MRPHLAHRQRHPQQWPPDDPGDAERAGMGAVVNEQTGQMSATVSEGDGAIVITGACFAP